MKLRRARPLAGALAAQSRSSRPLAGALAAQSRSSRPLAGALGAPPPPRDDPHRRRAQKWLCLEEKPHFHIPLEPVTRQPSRGGGQLSRTFAHGRPPYAGTAVESFDVQSTLSPSLEYIHICICMYIYVCMYIYTYILERMYVSASRLNFLQQFPRVGGRPVRGSSYQLPPPPQAATWRVTGSGGM